MTTNKSFYLSHEESLAINDLPTADDRYEFMKNYLAENEDNFKQISQFMESISKVEFRKISFPEIIPHIMTIALLEYPVAYDELLISMRKFIKFHDNDQF
jgi:hypothetical protein